MSAATQPESCTYVLGENGVARLDGGPGAAWTGLLRTHRRLIRELEAAVHERHGLSLSALELLGRLAVAPEREQRIARLAAQIGVSVSRTSRILDGLEARGLTHRRPCPEDGRATNVALTAAGAQLARVAQADHVADVQRRFFDRLTDAQVRTLATAFERLAPPDDPGPDG